MHTNLKSLHFHNELNISYLNLCLQSQWWIGIYIHFVILQLLDDLCIFPLWKIVYCQHFVLVPTEQQILCFCFCFSSDPVGYSLSFKIKHIGIYNNAIIDIVCSLAIYPAFFAFSFIIIIIISFYIWVPTWKVKEKFSFTFPPGLWNFLFYCFSSHMLMNSSSTYGKSNLVNLLMNFLASHLMLFTP